MQTDTVLVCSTAHFTAEDNQLLSTMATQDTFGSWVVNINYGYIIVLTYYRRRLLELKSQGASKALRCFLINQLKFRNVSYIHFDCDAQILPDCEIFEW
ncbi:DUF5983 family protein [Serratia sp. PAMC26656]|uniref:DUF5983 family protein n=1 Tax=Serratia sp. PAMC26656 TaxID=2775909 RepID=UPI00351C63BB